MQNINKLIIGEKLPYKIPKQLINSTSGSLEVRGDDWLEFNAFIPNVTQSEIEAFKSSTISIKYFGNSSKGKTVLYLESAIGTFECFFNPNIYNDDRMSSFMKCNNMMLFGMLIDSNNMTIKAIRYIPVPTHISSKIKSLWQCAIECGISKAEYDNWAITEIMVVNPESHFELANEIGKLRGGFTPASAVFIGD